MMMMDGLTRCSSSSKIVIDCCKLQLGASYYVGRGRFQPRISFSNCPGRLDLASLKCQIVLPLTSATSESHSQASETAVDAEAQLSTVRVKFQLQKACVFGDHFLMVGDDPLFGSWDPESAITMEWSDGHMWTAQLDVPVEKTIQFKFILKQSTGDILWQPGPDRVFKPWTTTKTIIVVEDWENCEMQKIVEDRVLGHAEELLLKTDAKNLDEIQRARNSLLDVAENITFSNDSKIVADNIVSDHKRFSSIQGLEDEEVILSDPVLVPGLTQPMSNLLADDSPLANKDKHTDLNGSSDQTALEPCSNSKKCKEVKHLLQGESQPGSKQESFKFESEEEQKAAVMTKREQRNKMKFSDEVEFDNPCLHKVKRGKDTPIQDVLIKDMHWSRKTLQNLLASLGFLVSAIGRIIHD